MRRTWIVLWAVAALLPFCAPPGAAQALGIAVAPASLEFENALRGATYERMLYVMNPSDEAGAYTLASEGYAGDWVHFYGSVTDEQSLSSVTVGARQRVGLVARVVIPEDAASGDYQGTILVTRAAEDHADGDSVPLAVQVRVPLSARVSGTQVLTGEVRGVSVRQTEVGYPLRAALLFRNTGNVVARPEIRIDLLREDQVIRSTTVAEEEVRTSAMAWIHATLDTAGLEAGDITARLTVLLGGEVIAESREAVALLPVGSLTRNGELVDLTAGNTPRAGEVLKLIARFRNTGAIETDARFQGEVQGGDDGQPVGLSSHEVIVLPGEEALLVAYVELGEPGSYRIAGVVVYGDKQTPLKELVLVMPASDEVAAIREVAPDLEAQAAALAPPEEGAPSPQTQARSWLGLGVLAVGALALLTLLALRPHRRARRRLM
ncbi:MAG: COG1470 family protein [Anaerolineae bacterium]